MLLDTIHHVWEHFYPVSLEEGAFIMNLGVLLFEMHHYREALLFFERSLQVGKENALVYQNMAACHVALLQMDEAFIYLQKAKLILLDR
jgi:tetratricopeptide (TPR) repeat protein